MADGDFIQIDPPITWRTAKTMPELNGHLGWPRGTHVVRVSGPRNRGEDGWPWDEEAEPDAVDRITLAYWPQPTPEGWYKRIAAEVQAIVDRFPKRTYIGHLTLHIDGDDAPVSECARLEVRDARALILRPTVVWS